MCKFSKPFVDFNRRGEGYQPYCRDCQKTNYRKYYESGKEKARLKESNERIKQEIRELIRMAKDVPCADCKVSYPHYVMDFDHLSDKKFNVGMGAFQVSRGALLAEIAKCEVVCANCHRERTHNGR